ncbi:hypothetical protein J5N97_008307 [Dioscorea zingiberensis]|uniref:PLATZ transcription factor family protein n=1 Tax=Dioscorea zingiberensis TaxID=325984 RepID=A0A9D5DDN7_9LILI|nr:hypothetical protein J5N97_008307 [Dioscorea zingiberensis]
MEKEEGKWPSWLEPLLRTTFFVPCKRHSDSPKMECNMFCLDCMNGALCSLCLSHHRDHQAIQIRRSSYHDVIRVSEIQKVLDVTGVQTYIINSARVVFLNQRPQTRPGKGISNACEVCDRSLVDSFRYCSLGCKINAATSKSRRKIMKNGNAGEGEKSNDAALQGFSPATPPHSVNNNRHRSSRRRKGIPHRAPFGIFAL